LRAVKLNDRVGAPELNFEINAKLNEKDRKSNMRVVGFVLTFGTKPSIAKFEVEGIAVLEGKNPAIDKLLEVNPERKIPPLLDKVYQHVFTSTYLMASLMNTPYPPPDMLSPNTMNKPGGTNGHFEWGRNEEAKPEEQNKPAAKTGKPKGKR